MFLIKRQLTFLIAAQLRLGHGDPVPRQLLADDPHGVHLADPESRHLEVHHDQVSLPRTGEQANCHEHKILNEIPLQSLCTIRRCKIVLFLGYGKSKS